MNKLIDTYFSAKYALHKAFGYQPDWHWVEIPMEDKREMYWMLVGGEGYGGKCVYSEEPFTIESIQKGETIYSGMIYTQRFLKKWVYRTPTHALVIVDTQTDGNKFLMILDAEKECTKESMREEYRKCW